MNLAMSYLTLQAKNSKKHQFLIQEGDSVTNVYFVVKGLLKPYHVDRAGKEHIMLFAMEDWWMFSSFFAESPFRDYAAHLRLCKLLYLR